MGPTIIIGLGGVGSEIVAMVEEQMLSLPAPEIRTLRQQLRFAIVDTDVSALRERKRKEFHGTVVQISDNMTVEKYLHYDEDAEAWFPRCDILSRKTLTEGAGQVRAISRLTLNLTLQKQEGLKPLYDTIDELHLMSEYNSDQATRVVVVSSLSGGTGSGIFLPLAMHLQEYLKQNYRNTEPIFKAFLIMPSLFDFVAGEAERRSLNANGYAAVKELNAFTLLQDRQIEPWQYPDLKIELTDGHGQKRKYYKSPYDLCFLFEKQNQDDKHLRSFEESKRNIANCVWMQTVNPALEQNGSLEDNLFKIVSTSSKSKRYERFAGMGVARLLYPYRKMEPYFSMVMAETVVQKDWYAADEAWERAREKRESEEAPGPQIDHTTFYCDFATGRSEWKDRIERVDEEKWVGNYLAKVQEQVKKRYQENKGPALKNSLEKMDTLQKSNKNRESWNENRLMEFQDAHERISQEQNDLFTRNKAALKQRLLPEWKPRKGGQTLQEEYQLEYWLLGNGNRRTPVENRYFLAMLKKRLQEKLPYFEKQRNEQKEKSLEYGNVVRQLREALKHQRISWYAGDFKRLIKKLESALKAIDESYYYELLIETYKQIDRAVEKLWQAYYALLREYTKWITVEKQTLQKNLLDSFESAEGRTIRFVCASEVCLKQMEDIVRGSVWEGNYGTDFAEKLCMEVLRQRDRAADADADLLKEFWSDIYVRKVGSQLDVDVLTALENEARWEYKARHQQELDESSRQYNEKVKSYMEEVFRKVHDIMIRAFLRIPDFQQRHSLEMCIYPSGLPREKAVLREIIEEQLAAKHGVENSGDGSGGKYQIDFYRAVFGVSAAEISTFLHRDESSPIPSGDGYNDYMAQIGSLDWQNRRNNFLTPHIDYRWHKTLAMPELSEEYGKKRRRELLKAGLFGLMSKDIQYDSGKYNIAVINGVSFDRGGQQIADFAELVDFMDESPVIAAGILDKLENAGRWDVLPEAENEELIDSAISEYCASKLKQNFGEAEIAELVGLTLLELLYTAAARENCRNVMSVTEYISRRMPRMLTDKNDTNNIKKRVRQYWSKDHIKAWVEQRMARNC